MPSNKPGYTLTMSNGQTKAVLKAVEFLMRLKLNQYDVIPYNLLDIGADDYCKRRDEARPLMEKAFNTLFKNKKPSEWKDDEWYTLYDLYQVIRFAIHEAENPFGTGVDSYPPRCTAAEKMAKCEVRTNDA